MKTICKFLGHKWTWYYWGLFAIDEHYQCKRCRAKYIDSKRTWRDLKHPFLGLFNL